MVSAGILLVLVFIPVKLFLMVLSLLLLLYFHVGNLNDGQTESQNHQKLVSLEPHLGSFTLMYKKPFLYINEAIESR